jgi:hypothetical protein
MPWNRKPSKPRTSRPRVLRRLRTSWSTSTTPSPWTSSRQPWPVSLFSDVLSEASSSASSSADSPFSRRSRLGRIRIVVRNVGDVSVGSLGDIGVERFGLEFLGLGRLDSFSGFGLLRLGRRRSARSALGASFGLGHKYSFVGRPSWGRRMNGWGRSQTSLLGAGVTVKNSDYPESAPERAPNVDSHRIKCIGVSPPVFFDGPQTMQ